MTHGMLESDVAALIFTAGKSHAVLQSACSLVASRRLSVIDQESSIERFIFHISYFFKQHKYKIRNIRYIKIDSSSYITAIAYVTISYRIA